MASVYVLKNKNNKPNGRRGVEFYFGGRRRIRLGIITAKGAEDFAGKVDRLVAAKRHNRPDHDATAWADGLDPDIREQLQACGLVELPPVRCLSEMLTAFEKSLKVKESTLIRWRLLFRNIKRHFGEARDPRTILPLSAAAFREWMELQKWSAATISKRIKDSRQIFAWAMTMGIVTSNPFKDIKAGDQSNPERNFFVTREMTAKVLDACPNAEWRLLVALSRFGGLRCPSEHLRLTWGDVLWDQNKLRVREGKTKERWMKITPELERELLAVFCGQTVSEAWEPIIKRTRLDTVNLRTQFTRIIRKAGLTPWPRIWHNLRASCQTELVETYPAHVVCAWIGNSEAVARKHYLMVPDHYYADAGGNQGERKSNELKRSEAQVSKVSADSEKNAGRADNDGGDCSRWEPNTFKKHRGKQGRPDETGGNQGDRDSIPDEVRMRRAQAVIAAAFSAMVTGGAK